MTFAAIAEAAIDACYAIGDAATYDPCDGVPKSVTVVQDIEAIDALGGGIGVLIASDDMTVRKSEITHPQQGDKVTVNGKTHTVDSWEPVNQWEWLLHVRA